MQYSPSQTRPLAVAASTEAQTYALFALAMAITVVGVFVGMQWAVTLLSTGTHFALLLVELAIIFTAGWWSRQSPLNYLMFAAFPFISGLTITPYLLAVLAGYANGASILVNALASTACMAAAAAVFARTTSWNLLGLGKALFLGLLGLIVMGILQLIFPALRGTQTELLVSGAGVALFGVFLAYDFQRVQTFARNGASPFMLALNLYLDIFNLFLYVLRFMTALSGSRR